jgi:hypothetical protein
LTRITVKLTSKELELLTSLASDQLFRLEFIDSRLPGYNSNLPELGLGKQLVARLRSLSDRATRMPAAKNGAAELRRPRTALARGTNGAG